MLKKGHYPTADALIQRVMESSESTVEPLAGDFEDGGFSNIVVGFLQSSGVRVYRNERYMPSPGVSTFVLEFLARNQRHYKLRVEAVDGIPCRARIQCTTTKYRRLTEGDESEMFETIRDTVLQGNETIYEELVR